MAEKRTSNPDVNEEMAAQRRWSLARRTDLADAFGVVLPVPAHGQDERGNWKYGLRSIGGAASERIVKEFDEEITEVIRNSARYLSDNQLLNNQQVDTIQSQPYSVGPAAQEWPKILFDFYQSARPLLNDGASLLAWGYFFLNLIHGVRTWASETERKISGGPESQAASYVGSSIMPRIVFTRPAIVALCFADMSQRHEIDESMTVESFPRSFTDFATVDHPGGQETYLIRFRAGRRSFFYHASGTAEITEHYLLAGSTVTLLPLPDFGNEGYRTMSREPGPYQRIHVDMKHSE